MRSDTNNRDPAMATAETHVPPQNLEAEASVLGAMMVSEGAIAPVILDVRLHDEDFYRERHRIVFRAITGLYEQGEPVDALTVSEYLAQHGELAEAGGKEAVSELASTVPVPGNARHYAQIVKQNALLRRLLATSQRIQKSVHEREGEPDAARRARREPAVQGRPRGARQRLPPGRGGPRRRDRPPRGSWPRATRRSPGRPPASATSTRSSADSSPAT